MLTFSPPEFEESYKAALKSIKSTSSDFISLADLCDGLIDTTEAKFNSDDYDDTIDSSAMVEIGLPRWEGSKTMTVGEFVELVQETSQTKFIDACTSASRQRMISRVEIVSFEDHTRLDAQLRIPASLQAKATTSSGNTIYCEVTSGLNPFTLLIAFEGTFSKYVPPVFHEHFIDVRSPSSATREDLEQATLSYMFELSRTFDINFRFAPRPVEMDDDYDETTEANAATLNRPLLFGKGLTDVFRLYKSAIASQEIESSLIYYIKVIEYVSATIVREKLLSSVMSKLDSYSNRRTDSGFVLQLQTIFDENRIYKADGEAISLVIKSTCDPFAIQPLVGGFMPQIASLTAESNEDQRSLALTQFCETLVATRNSIAHAKANYAPTGTECKEENLGMLNFAAQVAAQQAINYFARIPDDHRVLALPDKVKSKK